MHGDVAAHRARRWCHRSNKMAAEGRCYTSRQHGNGYQSGLKVADEVGDGERMLAAMADTHGGVARSYVTAAVAVK